jgi:sec-independent protein translocase protein TatA
MFGYNITTLIIILAIALLLFGPRRLPELGDSIGKAIRSFKKANEDPDAVSPQVEIPPSSTTAAPQAATCPQCHKDYTGDANFCPHCGQRIVKA